MKFVNDLAFLNNSYPIDRPFVDDDLFGFLVDKFCNHKKFRERLCLTGRLNLGDDECSKMIMCLRYCIQKEDGFPLKVIIAGSRSFHDYKLLSERMDYYLKDVKNPVIISGGARGADELGEKYAVKHNYPGERYPADWKKYGQQAGYIRNELMARTGDCLVAFWNGTSKGTEHMIKTMRNLKKPVRVVHV